MQIQWMRLFSFMAALFAGLAVAAHGFADDFTPGPPTWNRLSFDPGPVGDEKQRADWRRFNDSKGLSGEIETALRILQRQLKPLIDELENEEKWNKGGRTRFRSAFSSTHFDNEQNEVTIAPPASTVSSARFRVLDRLKRIQELAAKMEEQPALYFKPGYTYRYPIDQNGVSWLMAYTLPKDSPPAQGPIDPADYQVYLPREFFALGLSPQQQAALLAHELSHFPFSKRGDTYKSTTDDEILDPADPEGKRKVVEFHEIPVETRFSTSYYLQRYVLFSQTQDKQWFKDWNLYTTVGFYQNNPFSEFPSDHPLLKSIRRATAKIASIDVAKDIKGVIIRFSPLPDGSKVAPEKATQVEELVRDFLRSNETGVLHASVEEIKQTFHVVSLRKLVAASDMNLGPLTRVRGYVRDAAGELFLVGQVEKGQPTIPFDLFIAALRTVWKEGRTPFISLDPDARLLSGPQRVRIGGIAPDLRQSDMVHTMIEADYAMKEIVLGKVRPRVDGFRDLLEIMRSLGKRESMSRFWLAPATMPVGDVIITERRSALALLFQSEVRIMTEAMKQVDDRLAGTGETDAVATVQAKQLTHFYPKLEALDQRFRKLHVLFDLCKLASVWRAQGVKHQLLDDLAARPVALVAIPDSYPGLVVQKENLTAMGGVKARPRVSRKAVAATERLNPLLDAVAGLGDAGDRSAGEIALPNVLRISEVAAARALKAELRLSDVQNHLLEGRSEKAVDILNEVLELDPDLIEARATRASVLAEMFEFDRAKADVEIVQKEMPEWQALRGWLLIGLGDKGAGLRDAEESASRYPNDAQVAIWNTLAYMEAEDFDGAEKHARRLAVIVADNHFAARLPAQIAKLRSMSSEKRLEQKRLQRETPYAVRVYLRRGLEASQTSPEKAIPLLEKGLQAALDSKAPVIRDLDIIPRFRFMLALLYALQAEKEHNENGGHPAATGAKQEPDKSAKPKSVDPPAKKEDDPVLLETIRMQKMRVDDSETRLRDADFAWNVAQKNFDIELEEARIGIELGKINLRFDQEHLKMKLVFREAPIRDAESRVKVLRDQLASIELLLKKKLASAVEVQQVTERLAKAQQELKKLYEEQLTSVFIYVCRANPQVRKRMGELEQAEDKLREKAKLQEPKRLLERERIDAARTAVAREKKLHDQLVKQLDEQRNPNSKPGFDELIGQDEPLGAAKRGLLHSQALIDSRPARPSGHLVQSLLRAFDGATDMEILDLYDKAIARMSNSDPVIEDLSWGGSSKDLFGMVGVGLWKHFVATGHDGTPMLNRMIQMLGKDADVRFLIVLRDQKEFDLNKAFAAFRPEAFRDRQGRGTPAEEAALREALRKVEARIPDAPVKDSVSLMLATIFYSRSMQVEWDALGGGFGDPGRQPGAMQKSPEQFVQRLCERYLKFSGTPNPPDAVVEQLAKVRSMAMMMLGIAMLRDHLLKSIEREVFDPMTLQNFMMRMDKATKEKDVDMLRAGMREMDEMIKRLLKVSERVAREQFAQLQRETGALSSLSLQLFLVTIQKNLAEQFVGAGPLSDNPKDAAVMKLVKDTPEFRELMQTISKCTARLWIEKDPHLIVKECIRNVRNKSEAATMLGYSDNVVRMLTETKITGNKAPDFAALNSLQTEMRLRLATSQFSTEAIAEESDRLPEQPIQAAPPLAPDDAPQSTNRPIWFWLVVVAGPIALAILIFAVVRNRRHWKATG